MNFKMVLTVGALWPILTVASEVSCTSNSAFFYTEFFVDGISKELITSKVEISTSENLRGFLKTFEWTFGEDSSKSHHVSGREAKFVSFNIKEAVKSDLTVQGVPLKEARIKASVKDCLETKELTISTNVPWMETKFPSHGVCSRNYVTSEPNLFNPFQGKLQLPLEVESTGHASTCKNYLVFAGHSTLHSPLISFLFPISEERT